MRRKSREEIRERKMIEKRNEEEIASPFSATMTDGDCQDILLIP